MWLGEAPITKSTENMHLSKRHCNLCSTHVNHSRLTSQHSQGDLYDHIISSRIFTLILNKIITQAPKTMKNAATTLSWIY